MKNSKPGYQGSMQDYEKNKFSVKNEKLENIWNFRIFIFQNLKISEISKFFFTDWFIRLRG